MPSIITSIIQELRSSPVGFAGSALGILSFFGTASNVALPGHQAENLYYAFGFTLLVCAALHSALAFVCAKLFRRGLFLSFVAFSILSIMATFFSLGFYSESIISTRETYDHTMSIPFSISLSLVSIAVYFETLDLEAPPSDLGLYLFCFGFASFIMMISTFGYFLDREDALVNGALDQIEGVERDSTPSTRAN